MRNKYTNEHLQFIRENVKNTGKELVKIFNEKFEIQITVGILQNIKSKLGIRSGLVGGQFQKGQEPPNKGKKWSEFMSPKGIERSRNTCFKKGHIPKNHRPVGSERINVDGYIEIKVAEPNKWKLKHREIYENTFGKIPKAHKIVFLDGNKLNFDISNLDIISNSQSLIMNQKHYFSKNKELTSSGIITSKIICKMRTLQKNLGGKNEKK